MDTAPARSALLQLREISKRFGATTALDGAHLSVGSGEVHALLGENGAGKSTLMKIVAGVLQPDSGEFRWKGTDARFRSPLEAARAGINMIHQEWSLVPQLSVAENIFLGRWPARARIWLDHRRLRRRTREVLEEVGLTRRPSTPVGSLSPAEMQQVEIARALCFGSEMIIMDEPTSSLSSVETDRLFELIRGLVRRGVAVIYISHRLEEIEQMADRVTILRDGKTVESAPAAALSRDEVIRLMSGRAVQRYLTARKAASADEIFRASDVSVPPRIRGVSLSVCRGEVVGLAGLVGSGRTDLAYGLFGVNPVTSGQIFLEGNAITIRSPREAVRRGIGLLTEDRRRTGLVLGASIHENTVMAAPGKHARWGFFDRDAEASEVRRHVDQLSIRTPGPDTPVFNLSGGNQQKVVLSRWLYASARFLILDEPTRGIDVGSRAQIYRLIDDLSSRGAGILIISSEVEELIQVCHRILVMREGRLVGEVDAAEADEEKVLRLAVGAG